MPWPTVVVPVVMSNADTSYTPSETVKWNVPSPPTVFLMTVMVGIPVTGTGAADAEMLALLLLSLLSAMTLSGLSTTMNVCDAVSMGHVVSQPQFAESPLASSPVSGGPATASSPST